MDVCREAGFRLTEGAPIMVYSSIFIRHFMQTGGCRAAGPGDPSKLSMTRRKAFSRTGEYELPIQ